MIALLTGAGADVVPKKPEMKSFVKKKAWGQKKSIAIFGYKQRLLSLDMKTKLVQHVESEWMRDWKSVKVRKSEILR